jgi:hypothetical protein
LFVDVPPDTDWSRTGIRTMGVSTTYYVYPPFFAWIFSPLTHFSPRAAYFLWRALSIVMLLASTYLILRAFLPKVDLAAFLIAGVGVLSFFPFVEALYEGQVGWMSDSFSVDAWLPLHTNSQDQCLGRMLRGGHTGEGHPCHFSSHHVAAPPVEMVALLFCDSGDPAWSVRLAIGLAISLDLRHTSVSLAFEWLRGLPSQIAQHRVTKSLSGARHLSALRLVANTNFARFAY